jgi:multiple sugar transport system permease protein
MGTPEASMDAKLLQNRANATLVVSLPNTGAFNVWGQPVMLTNGGPNYQTQVLLMDIRNLAFPAGPAAAGMASAMALLLGIILMAIAAIQLIFMNKED